MPNPTGALASGARTASKAVASPGRKGGITRWGARALTLALVVVNAWWIWGDRSPASMKAIDAMISRGRLAEAELALEQRLRWSAHDGDARMKLARLLVKRGEHLASARQLHEVPSWWPAKVEASFLEGETYKLLDRARDSEAAWKACIVDDPFHPAPPRLFHGAAKDLVALYVLEGRLDEARRVLGRAFEEATPEERSGVLLTRVRLELERIDHREAVERLRAYLAAEPGDPEARLALALEEHATGDEAAADLDLDACFRARPDDALAWRARLEILNDRGDADALREAVAKLPSTTAADARTWMYRGLVRQRDGDNAGALDAFRRSAGLAPDDPEVAYKLGLAEVAAGRATEGRRHLARSRQLYQAFEGLRDGYQEYLIQLRRTPRDEAAHRSAIGRMATNLRLLGWPREADAWLAQVPGG
jgi:tetratricopeptide (TPR) repeat protein